MKLNFFRNDYKLDDIESETLKVALLDAVKYTEEQRSLLANDSKETPILYIKLTRLNELCKKFGVLDLQDDD